MKIRKRDLALLIITGVILLALAFFAIFNWKVLINFIQMLLEKTDIVKEYIQSFGLLGKAVLVVIIIFCFFFPIISSMPAQIAYGLAYGVIEGTIVISLTFFVASQIYYLIRKDLKILSKRKKDKDEQLKKMITNSRVSIHFAMLLAYIVPFIPFIIIDSLAYDGLKKYWQYLLYTLFGTIPEVAVTLLVGKALLETSAVASFISLILVIIVMLSSIIFKDKILEFIFKPKKEVPNGDSNK